MVNRSGFNHLLVRKLGEVWVKENILTIESAIVYAREKYNN